METKPIETLSHEAKLQELQILGQTLNYTGLLQERIHQAGDVNVTILNRIKDVVLDLGN